VGRRDSEKVTLLQLGENRCLIVDDIADTRGFLGTVLMSKAYSVSVARNGSEGVKSAREKRPDLIVLDVMLPDVNGTDLIPLFRKNNENVIIIMLTAYGSIENALQCGKAGADEYLEKSVHFEQLFAIIDEYLMDGNEEDGESASITSRGSSDNKFLHSMNRSQVVEPLKDGMEHEAFSRAKLALAATGGDKSKAARLLKISRMTLHRLLKKHENEAST
jgi:DNA-binding NtrC family response regulator